MRAIEPALPAALATPGGVGVFSGVYEFATPAGGEAELEVHVDGRLAQRVTLRSLPTELPRAAIGSLTGDWLNVLIASCYHRHEAHKRVFQKALDRIPKDRRPQLGLFLGDQVYLDLPTGKVFPKAAADLAALFLDDYLKNWNDLDSTDPIGLGALFAAAPHACVPDDHEYWNNYPHWAPAIAKSYSESGKGNWEQAAKALYRAFQSADASLDAPIEFDVPPLSFFLADSRTDRLDSRTQCMSPLTRKRLQTWVDRLMVKGLYGVFATGQSLIGNEATWKSRVDVLNLSGRFGDFSLSDYGDSDDVAATILRAARPGRPILCLTGDVHFGRFVVGSRAGLDRRPAFLELISSPTALVRTVGVDEVERTKDRIAGLFGRSDPWPRHGPAKKPAGEFRPKRSAAGGTQHHVEMNAWRGQRGDHITVASFQARGDPANARVALEVRCFSLHERDDVALAHDWTLETFELDKPPTLDQLEALGRS